MPPGSLGRLSTFPTQNRIFVPSNVNPLTSRQAPPAHLNHATALPPWADQSTASSIGRAEPEIDTGVARMFPWLLCKRGTFAGKAGLRQPCCVLQIAHLRALCSS